MRKKPMYIKMERILGDLLWLYEQPEVDPSEQRAISAVRAALHRILDEEEAK